MRSISEIVALLILLVAVLAAFVAVFVVVPKYFAAYNSIAVKASYSQTLEGIQTSAALSKHSSDYLAALIYNHGDSPATVSYYVECVDPYNPANMCFVGKADNVPIAPGDIHLKVYTNRCSSSMVCYLTVVESNTLIYKVLES